MMANFVATTVSNGARLKDEDAAQRVLDRFVWDGDVQAVIQDDEQDGVPRLCIYGYDWPLVWKLPDGMSRDDFELDDELGCADVFEDFLCDIAPFLAEPLTVQAAGTEACRFPISACEWHVQPGSSVIEVTGFKHSHAEEPATE